MIRTLKISIILILIIGCNRQDPADQIQHLEGYWEIKRVEIQPDSVREYKYNESIDFFDLTGNEGVRKKVRPMLDGTYQVTDDSENIEIIIEDEELYLQYTTPYDTWRERVLHAEENELKIENKEGLVYYYERYTPILNESYETEE